MSEQTTAAAVRARIWERLTAREQQEAATYPWFRGLMATPTPDPDSWIEREFPLAAAAIRDAAAALAESMEAEAANAAKAKAERQAEARAEGWYDDDDEDAGGWLRLGDEIKALIQNAPVRTTSNEEAPEDEHEDRGSGRTRGKQGITFKGLFGAATHLTDRPAPTAPYTYDHDEEDKKASYRDPLATIRRRYPSKLEPLWVSTADAARIQGISPAAVRKWKQRAEERREPLRTRWDKRWAGGTQFRLRDVIERALRLDGGLLGNAA